MKFYWTGQIDWLVRKNFGAEIPWKAAIWYAENSAQEALRWDL
jgi:hypothetical protein